MQRLNKAPLFSKRTSDILIVTSFKYFATIRCLHSVIIWWVWKHIYIYNSYTYFHGVLKAQHETFYFTQEGEIASSYMDQFDYVQWTQSPPVYRSSGWSNKITEYRRRKPNIIASSIYIFLSALLLKVGTGPGMQISYLADSFHWLRFPHTCM